MCRGISWPRSIHKPSCMFMSCHAQVPDTISTIYPLSLSLQWVQTRRLGRIRIHSVFSSGIVYFIWFNQEGKKLFGRGMTKRSWHLILNATIIYGIWKSQASLGNLRSYRNNFRNYSLNQVKPLRRTVPVACTKRQKKFSLEYRILNPFNARTKVRIES